MSILHSSTTITADDGVKLHVQDSQTDGRPVLLIHGWPLSSNTWEHQATALSDAGYRVIAHDRRGFGHSEASADAADYGYNRLAKDVDTIISALDLNDVTLVGFSMGGGEVARFFTIGDTSRIHSAVFACAVPPFLLNTSDNPEGPLTDADWQAQNDELKNNREEFLEGFSHGFFSVDDELKVSEQERLKALELAKKSNHDAALACQQAFSTTDFREDLSKISVPTLVIHGDSDAIVPFEKSGERTAQAVPNATVHVIKGAPHGANVSHASEFNEALLTFLNQ